MNRTFDVMTSWMASVARGTHGMFLRPLGKRPARMLELYEFEACPYCRPVRETLSVLDLEALVRPCPPGGARFRPEVVRLGGKQQFPFLVDPNTGKSLYESTAIIAYLYAEYGDGHVPKIAALRPLDVALSSLASAVRAGHSKARRSREPAQPLDLWSFEASPYCRIAREALCELELPYRLHNVGKKSPGRAAFVARSGRMMVPYLADPNTGKEMFESAAIVRYLNETYGAR